LITPPHVSRRSFLAAGTAALTWVSSRSCFADTAAWPDERTAGVFRCHADFSLQPQASLLGELGRLQDDLAKAIDMPAPREDIHLFLFSKKATYQAYLDQYFPKVPARKALFIKGRGPGMVFAYKSGELDIDVRHESTHALLHTFAKDIPLWLDEGLAEYFETPAADRGAKSPYVAGVRWNVRLGYIPSLDKLERMTDISEMDRNNYRDAWAWTHFLLHGGDDTRAVLRGYLHQLAAGEDPDQLSDHLRRRLGDPSARFTAHFRRWSVV
jgi:hypothetical protein